MEQVKDASGKVIGQKVRAGSRIIVQDTSGRTLGHFDENQKKTVDRSGKALYSGDQTSMLISESTD